MAIENLLLPFYISETVIIQLANVYAFPDAPCAPGACPSLSVVLFEEEIRHTENIIGQAAKIQEQLSEQLLRSQREAELTEKKFQRFAEQEI